MRKPRSESPVVEALLASAQSFDADAYCLRGAAEPETIAHVAGLRREADRLRALARRQKRAEARARAALDVCRRIVAQETDDCDYDADGTRTAAIVASARKALRR